MSLKSSQIGFKSQSKVVIHSKSIGLNIAKELVRDYFASVLTSPTLGTALRSIQTVQSLQSTKSFTYTFRYLKALGMEAEIHVSLTRGGTSDDAIIADQPPLFSEPILGH